MAERIKARFAELKAAGRAGFVAYVMAGDPDMETTFSILRGLPGAGADIIEVGFPFSDPMAEGPTIQRASERALTAGATLNGVLALVRRFRDGDQTTPVVMMGYLNVLLTHGLVDFGRDAAAAGVDAVIVVDCPPEEADPLADALDAAGVTLIRLATPTSDDARLKVIARRTAGFVYYVSVAGVTGVKAVDEAGVGPAVERIRRATGLPVAVGFGIRTPEQAASVARSADAVVVGSALVDAIESAAAANENVTSRVLETAARLAQAVRAVGQTVQA